MDWIITDDPYGEVWRRLLEFSNLDFAVDRIRNVHGTSLAPKDDRNVRKQARQIRVCLLQAREYFAAAEKSTLYTSPNHLYYGTVALATAVMLLRGDGTKALDYLRRDSRNTKHGLVFTTGLTQDASSHDINLLRHSHVQVDITGHFSNWYRTLPDKELVPARIHKRMPNHESINRDIGGWEMMQPVASLHGKKFSLIDLIKSLPDLSLDLERFGVGDARSRVTFEIERDEKGEKHYKFSIHGANTWERLRSILDGFAAPARTAEQLFECTAGENDTGAIVTARLRTVGEDVPFRYPSIREASDGELHIYAGALDVHELAEIYMATFGLSMLSRYYPDLWISCLESRCKATTILDRVVFTFQRRVPLLVLRFLERQHLTISIHKPHWYT